MKNLIGLLILVLLFSCNNDVKNDDYGYKSVGQEVAVIKFKYDKHDLIQFGYGAQRSIIHDPECEMKDLRWTLTEREILLKESSYSELFLPEVQGR